MCYIQIVFPTGGYAIGVSVTKTTTVNRQQRHDGAVIVSCPGNTEEDKSDLRILKIVFLLFAAINFIITVSMYANSNIADLENVSPYKSISDSISVFEKPSDDRLSIQQINFSFFIVILSMGCFGVVTESGLLVSMYALAVSLNFILCFAQIPYFLYAFRYLLDMVQLYIALVYRSRVTYTFLPMRMFDIRDRIRLNNN